MVQHRPTDAHAHPDGHAYRSADRDRHAAHFTAGHGDRNIDSDADPHCNRLGDTDRHANTDSDTYADTIAHELGDGVTYGVVVTHSDPNVNDCEHGHSVADGAPAPHGHTIIHRDAQGNSRAVYTDMDGIPDRDPLTNVDRRANTHAHGHSDTHVYVDRWTVSHTYGHTHSLTDINRWTNAHTHGHPQPLPNAHGWTNDHAHGHGDTVPNSNCRAVTHTL